MKIHGYMRWGWHGDAGMKSRRHLRPGRQEADMTLTFVSNYINHHQIPVSDELYRLLGDGYTFIQTEPVEEERLRMGWRDESGKLPYLKLFYEEPERCRELILNSDVVVFGGTDEESYIRPGWFCATVREFTSRGSGKLSPRGD